MNLATPSPPRPTLRRVKFAKKELVGGSLKIREFLEQGLRKMSCNAILVVFCGIISGYLAVPCSVPAAATLPFGAITKPKTPLLNIIIFSFTHCR